MFSILVFLGGQKRRKKKKTYNTEYLRKRNPCNLDNLHVLSDPVHQHSSLGTFICCPLSSNHLASFAMQCVAPSGGYIAFYTTLVSHPHEFHLLICEHSWSQIFCNPPFVPQFKKDGWFYENLTQKKMGFHQRGKKKKNPPVLIEKWVCWKANMWNTWNHTVAMLFPLHTFLSTL